MLESPGRKPLSSLTDKELVGMIEKSGERVVYYQSDVTDELRYRNQKSSAKWPVLIALAALGIQALAGIASTVALFI